MDSNEIRLLDFFIDKEDVTIQEALNEIIEDADIDDFEEEPFVSKDIDYETINNQDKAKQEYAMEKCCNELDIVVTEYVKETYPNISDEAIEEIFDYIEISVIKNIKELTEQIEEYVSSL